MRGYEPRVRVARFFATNQSPPKGARVVYGRSSRARPLPPTPEWQALGYFGTETGHSQIQNRPVSEIPHIPGKAHWCMLRCPRPRPPKAAPRATAPARPQRGGAVSIGGRGDHRPQRHEIFDTPCMSFRNLSLGATVGQSPGASTSFRVFRLPDWGGR